VVHIEAEPPGTITPRKAKLTLLAVGAGGGAAAASLGVTSAFSGQRSTQQGLAIGAAAAGAVALIGSGTALLLHMRDRRAETGALPPKQDPCSPRPVEVEGAEVEESETTAR
jgi:hypothetical protein